MPQIQFIDLNKYTENKNFIIGCDEVGYGCIAGPVVICGVKAPKVWNYPGLNDSKQLTESKRDKLTVELNKLQSNGQIHYHISERSNTEIDKFGIAKVLKECYVEIFKKLYDKDSLIVCDGNLKFENLGVDDFDKVSIVKADGLVPSVMAASILAKTYRDNKMYKLHPTYPEYDWVNNVGYGTAKHKQAIKLHGFTPLHRRSYKVKI